MTQLFPNLSAQNRDIAVAKYSGLGTPIEQLTAVMGEFIFIYATYFSLPGFRGSAFKGQFANPPSGDGDDVLYYFPSMNENGVPPFNNTAFDK